MADTPAPKAKDEAPQTKGAEAQPAADDKPEDPMTSIAKSLKEIAAALTVIARR